jgi:hypothetical protein
MDTQNNNNVHYIDMYGAQTKFLQAGWPPLFAPGTFTGQNLTRIAFLLILSVGFVASNGLKRNILCKFIIDNMNDVVYAVLCILCCFICICIVYSASYKSGCLAAKSI